MARDFTRRRRAQATQGVALPPIQTQEAVDALPGLDAPATPAPTPSPQPPQASPARLQVVPEPASPPSVSAPKPARAAATETQQVAVRRGFRRISQPAALNARIPLEHHQAWNQAVHELNRQGLQTTQAELLCAWVDSYEGTSEEADQLLEGWTGFAGLARHQLRRANPEVELEVKNRLAAWSRDRRTRGLSGTIAELTAALIARHAADLEGSRRLLMSYREKAGDS